MDTTKNLKRNIFQRLFGICATQFPQNDTSWAYNDGELVIDLSKTPELNQAGAAIRIEHENLKERLLIVHGDDDLFYAFKNHCEHGGRRLDPVPGAGTVQCCSIGKSTYDYKGKVMRGSAKENITTFPVTMVGEKLVVQLVSG